MKDSLGRIHLAICRGIDRVERWGLSLLMTALVVLAAVQILLRNVWHTGLQWAEPVLGMGLLWMTMLGALAATGLGRHLAIDLAAALLPRQWKQITARITSIFAIIVCLLLMNASIRFVGFQKEMRLGELLGLPVWMYYQVIPATFALMALRFLHRVLVPAAWLEAADRAASAEEGGGEP